MRNILSREDYLQSVNEGFIGNAIKKGVNKLKSMFSFLMKKVKNFIAIFDEDGNVLPVVSVQAVIDNSSDTNAVNVYAPQELVESTVSAGGTGCETTAKRVDKEGFYTYMEEDSNEYKNFLTLSKLIKENFGADFETEDQINERMKYSRTGEKLNAKGIRPDEFRTYLNELIGKKLRAGKKSRIRPSGVQKSSDGLAYLVWGAPGIGKSTIPNIVIDEYNKNKSSMKDKMTLINIDCGLLGSDGFMMPTIPLRKDISGYINRNKNDIPSLSVYDEIDSEELNQALKQQKDAQSAPPKWLPCYHRTGNAKIDAMLDECANGGIDMKTGEERGGGGIILLDELFRADPAIFSQLMNFLFTKEINGEWRLGSKWSVIACSNRPADSKIVSKTWEEVGEGAVKGRFRHFLLVPDPEQWKNYMRSQGVTGPNEILFKFIFDDEAKDGDEYRRWHEVDSKQNMEEDDATDYEKSESITEAPTPRNWEYAWDEIVNYLDDHDLDSICQIPLSEFEHLLGGIFYEKFINEFITWLRNTIGNVKIEDIIEDPLGVFPSKTDEDSDVIVIKNLWEQFEKKYGKKGDCPDDDLANIFIWLGIHYREQANIVDAKFIQMLDKVLKSGTDTSLETKEKTIKVMMAAYPSKGDFEGDLEGVDEVLDEVKDLMRKYFPWRIDGDKILFIDDYED